MTAMKPETRAPVRTNATSVRNLVEERAQTDPGLRAVGRRGAGWLTLGELDRRAGELARRLAGQGVGRGDVVGLLLPRSVEFVVAVFAVWKTGAAYTPIDPAAPERHRSFVLENSDVEVVITADETAGRATGRLYCLVGSSSPEYAEPFTSVPLAPEDPAWILYTSGSTGRPKGVVGSHGASLNRCTWMWEAQPFRSDEVTVQNTAPSVVDSLWEVWGSLAAGTPVVLPPADASLDLDVLVGILAENGVTRLCLVPSLLRALLTTYPDLASRLPDIRIWTCSGEVLDRDLAELFRTSMSDRILLNQYGLTESCADVTTFDTRELTLGADDDARVPIGRPTRGTEVFIVDEDLRPVADGEPGELLLAGTALANGYANAPELTAGRFLVNGLGTGVTVFRTGDVVRLGPDGNLRHLGRRDRQVKIRGFRVEPEGVEAVLQECPGVRDAAVRAWTRGDDTRLVAYLLPQVPGSPPDSGDLRARLSKALPSHAIPASFVVLTEFPRTGSGKTDYNLLPEPAGHDPESTVLEPRNEVEEAIAQIWRETLRTGGFGVLDDFFELGGHSLALMRVIARLNATYGVRLPRRDVMADPTVESLARLVGRSSLATTSAGALEPPADTGFSRASETQSAMWLHEQWSRAPGLYNIRLAFRITGDLDAEALGAALRDVVAEHRALRLGLRYVDGALRLQDRDLAAGPHWTVSPTSDELVRTRLEEDGSEAFDLAQGPLLRGLLLKVSDTDHVLGLTVHHAVCDGQSLRPLLTSLSAAYAARAAGVPPRFQPSTAPVAVEDPPARPSGERYPPLELPMDRPRPAKPDASGAVLNLAVPRGLATMVHSRARRLRTTAFTLCCAAFATLAAAKTGQRQFAISIPIANRNDPRLENAIGCYVRTVPLNLEVRPAASLPELLAGIRSSLDQAYDAPSVSRVDVGGRPPQVMLAYDEAHESDFSLSGVKVTPMKVGSSSSKLDLTLYLDESATDYSCRIEYLTGLFDEDTIRRFGQEYLETLASFCGEDKESPAAPLNETTT